MNQNSGMMRLLIGLVVGVVLGLGLGLLFGYVIAPVQWIDGSPQDLRQDYAAHYWALVTEFYDKSGDWERAQRQLGEWPDAEKRQAAIEYAGQEYGAEMLIKMEPLEERLYGASAAEATPVPGEPPTEKPSDGKGNIFQTVGLVLLLLVLLGAIVFVLIRRMRKPKSESVSSVPAAPQEEPDWVSTIRQDEGEPQSPPLGHFVTSYALGNNVYDESFSVESSTGDFLGECGVGISETIGVGDPDKVTAFEVWLFDKNDIRTVTKVLMSEHAYNDQELRARLATKGEPVLALPNQPITLETMTLCVDAMVTEVMYGAGEQAANSFFERMTIELVARNKEQEDQDLEGGLAL